MNLLSIISILGSHYISDFLLQSKLMANKKSKNIYWLITHGLVYGLSTFVILLICNKLSLINIDNNNLVLFVMLNMLVHIFVDTITSRLSTKLYKMRKYRSFFNVIGLDQLIHTVTLLTSFNYFCNIIM